MNAANIVGWIMIGGPIAIWIIWTLWGGRLKDIMFVVFGFTLVTAYCIAAAEFITR